jgi:cycloeucalenol cycloisomerase
MAVSAAERWHERAVLAYTPIWMVAVATLMFSRAFAGWGDGGHLLIGAGLALPLWLLPFLAERDRPFLERYATRFAAWIAVTTFVQAYFGSLFFFERLGMEYHFPVKLQWNGTPVFLYLMTIAYFSTYYTVLGIVVRTVPGPRPLVAAVACYAVAFAETWFMASDLIKEWFFYRNRDFVQTWGSLCYGTVFFVTLPSFLDLRERPLRRGIESALAANLVVLILYELYGALIALR